MFNQESILPNSFSSSTLLHSVKQAGFCSTWNNRSPDHHRSVTKQSQKMGEFPTIKSTHSLVAKHVTPDLWEKLSGIKTKTSGFTLAKAIACAVEFDDQVKAFY